MEYPDLLEIFDLKRKIRENRPALWMQEQIEEDFAHCKPFDVRELDRVVRDDWLLARCRITNNHLEIKSNQGENKRVTSFENSLRKLLLVAHLPDIDCMVCLNDSTEDEELSVPLLAFAKEGLQKKQVILIPDFEALEGNASMLDQVKWGRQNYPWDKKIGAAFWRGAATGGIFTPQNFLYFPRSQLITLSQHYPQRIDARFVAISSQQCADPAAILDAFPHYFGYAHGIEEHLRYKYQILIDGNSCAFSRAYWQLFSNCLIFKQKSSHIQWYYRALNNEEHYISLNPDCSDLLKKMEWAHHHPHQVATIIENANAFAHAHLTQADVYYYLYLVLQRYSHILA